MSPPPSAELQRLAAQATDQFDRIHADYIRGEGSLYRRLLRKCMFRPLAPEVFDDAQKRVLLHHMAELADTRDERSAEKIRRIVREQHGALVAKALFTLDAFFDCFPTSRNTRTLRRNVRACQESVSGKRAPSPPADIAATMAMLEDVLSVESPAAPHAPTPSPTPPPGHPPRGTTPAPARSPRTPPGTPPPAPPEGATDGSGG